MSAQQTPVECSRTACILGAEVRAHHTAVPWLRVGVPQRIDYCCARLPLLAWFRHTLHASCVVWQTSTHDDDCAPCPHPRSTCHRRVMLPSATVLRLRISGTLCRPTSRHRHHCLFYPGIVRRRGCDP